MPAFSHMLRVVLAFMFFLAQGFGHPAFADTARVAVASNFASAAKQFGRAFDALTGHHVAIVTGSTGKLYAQIRNVAPFDAFLSADRLRPELLEKQGAAGGLSGVDGRREGDGGGEIGDMLTRLDLQLATRPDAEALIEGVVAGHDDEYHLSHVDFAGGRFTVARQDLTPGHGVRIRVSASDVSLTLARQTDTSILNIFPATVAEIRSLNASQVTARLLVAM